jgi:peptide/nickel transport system permease protein
LISSDFVVAAKTLGYSSLRIVVRHIMPLVARTTGTVAAGDMLLVVGVVAALPFLGAGVQPPNPEWGVMMYEGRGFLQQTPLLVLAPTLLIVVFGIGVTLTVDRRLDRGSLRDSAVDVVAPPELDQEVRHG